MPNAANSNRQCMINAVLSIQVAMIAVRSSDAQIRAANLFMELFVI